jgi:mono/diheme cytochrome c family protein
MFERAALLKSYRIEWPALDAAFALAAVRGAMALCVLTGVAWALSGLMRRLQQGRHGGRAPSPGVPVLVALLACGAIVSPRPAKAQPAQAQPRSTMAGVYTAAQAQKGREVFNASCLGCHTVASHTGPSFQLKWFGRPLADLFDYVSNLMPKSAPGTLTEDEYVWVMAYILRLNGMPAGTRELNAEPALLKAVRIDSARVGRGSSLAPSGGHR